MAKPNLFDRLSEAGIRSTLIQIFNAAWPWTFVVLTAVGQWLEPVPWPYFFSALGVVASLTFVGIAIFSDWRAHRRIDNKITVNLQNVFQYPIEDDPGKCGSTSSRVCARRAQSHALRLRAAAR